MKNTVQIRNGLVKETCSVCVWSWGNTEGKWWCKLGLDPDECEGPKNDRNQYDDIRQN